MQLVCDQCQATYELDPPAAPFARDQNLVFRCTACGHSIPMRRGEPDKVASVLDAPDRPEVAQNGFLLRQEGKLYQVKDVAMLQRWIAERRIWRTDEISEDGQTWKKADQLEGSSVFFDLVDQAEQSSASAGGTGKGLFAKPQNAGDPLASIKMPEGDATEKATQEVVSEVVAEEEDLSDSDEDTSIVEVEESEPVRLAVEAIPEELPAPLLSMDEPTMDEEDFFSEEQDVGFSSGPMTSGSDYDDELEWMQAKRKNMVTWWLLFFGALGGAGYFALDFLNQQDSKQVKQAEVEDAEPVPDEPSLAEVPPDKGQEDSGEASEKDGEPTDEAVVEGEAVPQDVEEEVAEAPPPPPAVAATPPPPVTPAAAPPRAAPAPTPGSINPGREVDRGWSKIDGENWSAARTHFSNALRADPGNGDAKFGLAYVNENQGRVDEAVRQYCRLQSSGSGEAKAEASGRLRALGRDCP